MSERKDPITRTCNFCGKGMTGVRPIPKSLVISRGLYFKPKVVAYESCGGSATFQMEIALKVDGSSGHSDSDICLECEKELAEVGIHKMLFHDYMDQKIFEAVTNAENRMKDESLQISRRHMESIFGPMLDAHMAHRRSRKKGGA